MTSPITNTIIDKEWEDGDDDQLWFEGYQKGYCEGVIKSIEIINSVRDTPNVERVPFHLTMSAVASTLREIAKGNGNGVS